MEVYAYQDEDVWNAVIHKYISDEKYESWYIELGSSKEILDDERVKWNSIRCRSGICIGEEIIENEVIARLINHGYNLNQIGEIIELNDELKKNISKIKGL